MSQTSTRFRVVGGALFAVAMVVVAMVQLQGAYDTSLLSTATLAADSYVNALDATRTLYTSEVVSRLPEDVRATHDYALRDNEVPLPATLTHLLAEQVGASVPGLEVRLYSEYPFPWRAPVVMDDFEQRALEALRENPDSTYSEVMETAEGRTLRFARGDPMRPQCVSCHNTRADSPKTDWRVGDLRGVLAISFPLATFQENARAARRPYEMLLLLAVLGLLGAVVILAHAAPAGFGIFARGRAPDRDER